VKCIEFFPGYWHLELIRAEMIMQAVWAWRPSRLRNAHIFFPRPVVTAGCFEHSKHIIQHAE